ncbi:SpoIIE family protein phosphatase [Streptomyces sp. NBC_01190]|uniref:SpoIIE family protein phosphatase n=1 Tax=Streptomyces sp. NBC_01190 TaxID=2903767 RepID=UPI0038649657|nr:SpoIIE family protein phosphatase [Streptomyces sp. NBC_01190]
MGGNAPGRAASELASAGVRRTLVRVLEATGAHVAAAYLPVPDEQVLRMVAVSGVSARIARPWSRVAMAAPVPVADAARERRRVWIPSHDELARRYPRTALALPYQVAMGVSPLLSAGDSVKGVLLLLWPGTHRPELSDQEALDIGDAERRITRFLAEAELAGDPLRPAPEEEPSAAEPLATGGWRQSEMRAAADLTDRFEEGYYALDLDGRISYLNSRAADFLGFLGADRRELLGVRPWEVVRWLHGPTCENSFLEALFSRLPTSFSAQKPPDQWLSFALHPDATGVSVRITALDRPPGGETGSAAPPVPPQAGVGILFYLMHLSAALSDAVGVKDVTDAVTEQIMPVISAQGVALVIEQAGRLQVLGAGGFPRQVWNHFNGLPLSADAPSVRVLATGTAEFFPDTEELARTYPDRAIFYARGGALAYLPMIVAGRPIGCCVVGYQERRAFPPDERTALTALGGMIGQALERATLYDTTNQVARGLQAALLPHVMTEIPGLDSAACYLPASQGMDIGGDFYDLIRLDETTAAAVIGDVQGHNVNAAALMGQVRTAIHTHASSGAPPGEVLARANRLLIDLHSPLFASCLYVQLDLRGGRALLATAGHPPPVLRHPDRRTEVLSVPPGLLLGIEPDAEYGTVEIQLPPGALLALYTDGLVERPGVDLGEAIEGFARHVGRVGIPGAPGSPGGAVAPGAPSLEEQADALIEHVRTASDRSDDIALLLLSRREPTG